MSTTSAVASAEVLQDNNDNNSNSDPQQPPSTRRRRKQMRWILVIAVGVLVVLAVAAIVLLVVDPWNLLESDNKSASLVGDDTTTTLTTNSSLAPSMAPSSTIIVTTGSPTASLAPTHAPTRSAAPTMSTAPTTVQPTTQVTTTVQPSWSPSLSSPTTLQPTTQPPPLTVAPTSMQPTPPPSTTVSTTTPTIVDDLQQYLTDQIDAGVTRIVVPPGTYRLEPDRRQHLRIWDAQNVEIVLTGVQLVCTQTTRAITIGNSQNVTLVGPVTVDYDPLPFTQGRIVGMSDDRGVHDIELDQGYLSTAFVGPRKYEIFRPDTRTLRFGSYHNVAVNITANQPRRFQVIKDNANQYEGEQVGDIIAIDAQYAPDGSVPHAIMIQDSSNITLQDVTLYASNSFGFFEDNCHGNRYTRCRVDRREDDFVPRAAPRIRSLNADAFHSKHATLGPNYTFCEAQFMADDGVAVNGDYHMIMSMTDGTVLRVLAKPNRFNIQPGDPLELLDYNGRRIVPNAVAVTASSQPIDTITDDEREFVQQQRLNQDLKNGMTDIYQVTIDRNLDQNLPRGSLVGAANRMGNGVIVTGCKIGNNRSRGILIKASQATIKDNVVEGVWMESIKVASEFSWLEAGSSSDVLIDGNVIRNGNGDGIAVYAYTGRGYREEIAPAGAHHDVVIRNNVIQDDVEGRHIWVTSTDGVVLSNNTYGAGKIVLEECENVEQLIRR